MLTRITKGLCARRTRLESNMPCPRYVKEGKERKEKRHAGGCIQSKDQQPT